MACCLNQLRSAIVSANCKHFFITAAPPLQHPAYVRDQVNFLLINPDLMQPAAAAEPRVYAASAA